MRGVLEVKYFSGTSQRERPPLDVRIGLALETTLSFCRDGRKGAWSQGIRAFFIMENTRSKFSHSDVFNYLLYSKDGSRKRRRKSRTSGGQSRVHWTFHSPCERTQMFVWYGNSLLGFYFYYFSWPSICIKHLASTAKVSFIFHQNIEDTIWQVGCYQINPTTPRGQKFFILHMLVKFLNKLMLQVNPNPHVCRCFPWSRSQPWWSRTAWTWTPCLDIRTGSPPSDARWKHNNFSKLIIPNLQYSQNLNVDRRGN